MFDKLLDLITSYSIIHKYHYCYLYVTTYNIIITYENILTEKITYKNNIKNISRHVSLSVTSKWNHTYISKYGRVTRPGATTSVTDDYKPLQTMGD